MWVQNSEELFHHGVKGMRWGVRRSKAQLSRSRGSSKKGLFTFKKKKVKTQVETKPKKKSIEDMTDEELNAAIKRLELEKKYKDLGSPAQQKKIFDGKKFVTNVLEKSAENIGTQAMTYAMGTALNKAMGSEIVNPKKGQKDK